MRSDEKSMSSKTYQRLSVSVSVSVKSTSANLGTPPWPGSTVSHKIQ